MSSGSQASPEHWIARLSGVGNHFGCRFSADGSIYVVGQFSSGKPGVAKYSTTGAILWQKELSTSEFSAAAVDSNGDVVCVGGYTSPQIGWLIAKYRGSDGVLLWQRGFYNGSTFSSESASGVATSGTDIYVCGKMYDGNMLGVALKLDGSGGLQWQKKSSSASIDSFSSVACLSNGNLCIATNAGRFFVADSSGSKLLERAVSGESGVVSAWGGSGGFCFANSVGDHPEKDIFMATFTSDGTLYAKSEIGISNGTYESPIGIASDSSQDVYVSGYSGSAGLILVRWDSGGNLVWQRRFSGTGQGRNISLSGTKMLVTDFGRRTYLLPKSGAKTGTYGSVTYQASSFTAASSARSVDSSNTFSLVSSGYTLTTTSLTETTPSYTRTIDYLP